MAYEASAWSMGIRGKAFGVISSSFSNQRNWEKIDSVVFVVVRTEQTCSATKILFLAKPWNSCFKGYREATQKRKSIATLIASPADPCLLMMLNITVVAWRNKCIIWNKVGKERISELWKVVAENLSYGSLEIFGVCVGGGGRREGVTHWGSGKSCEVRVMCMVGSGWENSGVLELVAPIGLQEPIVKCSRIL